MIIVTPSPSAALGVNSVEGVTGSVHASTPLGMTCIVCHEVVSVTPSTVADGSGVLSLTRVGETGHYPRLSATVYSSVASTDTSLTPSEGRGTTLPTTGNPSTVRRTRFPFPARRTVML